MRLYILREGKLKQVEFIGIVRMTSMSVHAQAVVVCSCYTRSVGSHSPDAVMSRRRGACSCDWTSRFVFDDVTDLGGIDSVERIVTRMATASFVVLGHWVGRSFP